MTVSSLTVKLCSCLTGTVTNVDEAVRWLSYSYLYVRMRKNPLVYGITYQELRDDPTLEKKRRDIVVDAARKLDKVIHDPGFR